MGWLDQVASNVVREGFNAAFPPPRRGQGGGSGCVFLLVFVGAALAYVFR